MAGVGRHCLLPLKDVSHSCMVLEGKRVRMRTILFIDELWNLEKRETPRSSRGSFIANAYGLE